MERKAKAKLAMIFWVSAILSEGSFWYCTIESFHILGTIGPSSFFNLNDMLEGYALSNKHYP